MKYLKEHLDIQIDGIEETNGMIDLTVNAGAIFYVRGRPAFFVLEATPFLIFRKAAFPSAEDMY